MFLFAMGNSDTSKAGSINKNVRHIISGIFDIPTFFLLSMVFQLFFNVTTVEIFSGKFLMNFYGRVQVILGVFMLFQLSMTIIKGIVDPDSINDKKTGVSNLIRRIATALIMLVLLVPIRYNNPSNEYERQLNNNGILFGTLYSLQYRIIKNNTLGKIVFGNKAEENNFSGNNSASNLKKASNRFVGSIIRTFYRINLKDDDGDVTNHADWMCDDDSSGWPDGAFEAYTDEDAKPYEVISLVDDACKSPKRFVLAYTPLLPAIVAVILSILILSFTIDVAIRTIKLGVLKLVAPIPIISYMDPKGSKDSAFNSWVKQLTSTYLDLFIRLIIIYFVVYLAMEISQNGLVVRDAAAAKESNTIIWLFTKLVIYIGLFAFAKQAPKFLKDIFGIKDDGAGFGGLFKGLGTAMGVGAVAAGALSGGISRATAYDKPENSKFARMVKGAANLGAGTIGGGWNAGKDLLTKKDTNAKDMMSAIRARNMQNYSNAADDSTAKGRFMAGLQSNLGMKNEAQKMDDKIKYYGAAESAMGRIGKAFDGNGDYQFTYNGPDITDKDGNTIVATGSSQSLKSLNDLSKFYASDGAAAKKLDDAKKSEQGKRFLEIRQLSRDQIENNIKSGVAGWTTNDLIVYDSAKTMYDVATKYSDEPEFSNLSSVSFDYADSRDPGSEWGKVWKHDAGQAGKSAEQIKNSAAYSQAQANAQRVADKNKNK